MDNSKYTKDNEINDTKVGRPHLVILGAGASYAAFPNGDKNGRKLPLMNNLVEVVGLQGDLDKFGVVYSGVNFEKLYATIHEDKNLSELVKIIEEKIYNYFQKMELPEEPTIYDYLVLGLREKDVIATFNWDPFLFQALKRNYTRVEGKIPRAIYLHGNVAIGYTTENGKSMGPVGCVSSNGGTFQPTKLLYPVTQKNYSNDLFISEMWKEVKKSLKNSLMVTVFGYGAPESDVEAIQLFKEAWGNADDREFEEIEIIDIRDKEELAEVWNIFIHTHHYSVSKTFYNSWIFRHPRRSLEAFYANTMMAQFTEGNPYPKNVDFNELDKFLAPLLRAEKRK